MHQLYNNHVGMIAMENRHFKMIGIEMLSMWRTRLPSQRLLEGPTFSQRDLT